MSKVHLLIVVLCASLWAEGSYAQETYVLTMEQMLALVDKNSKTLKVEDAAEVEAHQGIRVAQNGYFPDIDISLSASYLGNGYLLDRDFSNGQEIKMPHFGNSFAVRVSQLIYGGGAVVNGVALAKLKKEMAETNIDATRSRVRFMFVGFYLDLSKLYNLLKVYERNIKLAKVVLEETKARNETGLVLQNDVTRYELQLENLQLAKSRIVNSLKILNYDLAIMLGLPSDVKIVPDYSSIEQILPSHDLMYWQDLAQSGSPVAKQSALSVEISKCNERLARSEMRPKIAFVAANNFEGPITIEIPTINKNYNYWYVGVGLSFKLSSFYKANKVIKQARYNTMTSCRRQEDALEQILLSVQSDYTKYIEAYDDLSTLEKSLEMATENFGIIENRYRNDIALVTDMLDALNQLLDAELKLANARINVVFNYYKLKNTSGVL